MFWIFFEMGFLEIFSKMVDNILDHMTDQKQPRKYIVVSGVVSSGKFASKSLLTNTSATLAT